MRGMVPSVGGPATERARNSCSGLQRLSQLVESNHELSERDPATVGRERQKSSSSCALGKTCTDGPDICSARQDSQEFWLQALPLARRV